MNKYIECPICGKELQCLYRHLKVHGYNSSKFREDFPDSPLTSELFDARKSSGLKDMWEEKRDYIISKQIEGNSREEVRAKRSENSKKIWQDTDRKKEHIQKIKESNNLPENREKMSRASKKAWEEKRDYIISRQIEGNNKLDSKINRSQAMKDRWKNNYEEMVLINKRILSDQKVLSKLSDSARKAWTKELRDRQSLITSELWKDSEYRERVMSGYNSCIYVRKDGKHLNLRSSYEYNVCKILESLDIDFEYEVTYFPYEFDGKKHMYFPDFYLPLYNLYLEVKPEIFQSEKISLTKLYSVLDRGYNIVFIGESEIEDISLFIEKIRPYNFNDYPKAKQADK